MTTPLPLSRREAVSRMLAAAATISLLDFQAFGVPGLPTSIGTDPNLRAKIIPWDRVLTEAEMKTVTALCDVIIPADDKSPAASALGVPDFINEWVSAPYAQQVADREQVRKGLAWLEAEATKRFQAAFSALDEKQQQAICDDLCFVPKAKPEHREAAEFFAKMRNLAAGGFYTTPEGWKDLGYIGNVAMAEFPGPPPEVLAHLGLRAEPGSKITIREGGIHVQNLKTRMPFRYGIATMSTVPHVIVQLTVEIDGKTAQGTAADHLPPKWFTKNPQSSYAEDVRDMMEVISHAVEQVKMLVPATSVFALWQELYGAQKRWGSERGFPPLLWNFGVSLVERAVIEAFCRVRQVTFAEALRTNQFGISLGSLYAELAGHEPAEYLPQKPLESIQVRHTVGLSDPLTTAEIPPAERVRDGLPQSLEECLRVYDLRLLKIKLSGDVERDRARLQKIGSLMGSACQFTLDGNENYHAVAPFRALWEGLYADPHLTEFMKGLIFVEQPFHRDLSLTEETRKELLAWRERPPIIIDESEGEVGTLALALAGGYVGTSHKNCKGIFKGIANTCLVAHRRRLDPALPLQMSAEDLSNVPPIALLQDLAVIAALGIPNAERNGHHYFTALQQFAPGVQKAVAAAHPDLLRLHEGGFPIVRVEHGAVDVRSVNTAPLGVGCPIALDTLTPLQNWTADSLSTV